MNLFFNCHTLRVPNFDIFIDLAHLWILNAFEITHQLHFIKSFANDLQEYFILCWSDREANFLFYPLHHRIEKVRLDFHHTFLYYLDNIILVIILINVFEHVDDLILADVDLGCLPPVCGVKVFVIVDALPNMHQLRFKSLQLLGLPLELVLILTLDNFNIHEYAEASAVG